MKKYLVTCDYNLEDLVIQEIKEKVPQATHIERFRNFTHRVSFFAPSADTLFQLRSIHNIIELKADFYLENPTLENLKAAVMDIDLPELQTATSFRATCERYGAHEFTSLDMQRHVGHTVILRYNTPVDLDNAQYNVRVDILGHHVFVGYQLTKDLLSHRTHLKREFHHKAATKHSIAYHLLKLANVEKGETLLDCTLGGGTILLEAADIFGDSLKLIGGDLHESTLAHAKQNFQINHFDYVQIRHLDARHLDDALAEDSVDKIVCNLPFGVKSATQVNMRGLYEQFLTSAYKVLKSNGRIVVLTMRQGTFREVVFILKKYKISQELVTEAGGLYLHIFVLEKL